MPVTDPAEFQPLFAQPVDGERAWTFGVETKLGIVDLPLVDHQVEQEIKDQAEIKATQRKAIIRATQKAIVRVHKLGLAKLSPQDVEQYKWNLFILAVDQAIGGRHAALRADPGLAAQVLDEGYFGGS